MGCLSATSRTSIPMIDASIYIQELLPYSQDEINRANRLSPAALLGVSENARNASCLLSFGTFQEDPTFNKDC